MLELTPPIRAKVENMMAHDSDSRYTGSFPKGCTWADDDRHKPHTIPSTRASEHFVNLSRSLDAITTETCGTAPKCLLTAIDSDETALQTKTGKKQRDALKFLGHWVGDLHQPLHISYADDKGGNDIPIPAVVSCPKAFGPNLHATWDDCVVDVARAQLHANGGVTDFGTKLQADITDSQRTAWKTGDLVSWAAESYTVTRAPDTKYCVQSGGSCCYDAGACTFSGGTQTQRLMSLSHTYDNDHAALVKVQLQRAGVRLAALLTSVLK